MELIVLRARHMSDGSFALSVILPVVLAFLGFAYMRYKHRKTNKYWITGVFPHALPFNQLHLMMAHLSAASLLISRDKSAMLGKVGYINAYFRKHFRESYHDFRDALDEALLSPVTIASLTEWLNLHLDAAQRMEVVRFLTGLAFYDGSLNKEEYALLTSFSVHLKVDQDDFNNLIDSYVNQHKKSEGKRQSTSSVSNMSRENRYSEVLGIVAPFTREQVKRSYRKLAMQYHPDKFQQDSEEVRMKASAKFLEVQEAYEYFEARLN